MKFLGGIASLLIVSLSLGEAAQSVTLAWDANSEPNIVGYVLRYGTTQGKPSQSINVDKSTTATVSNLASGKTYFFTVTARNHLGLESQTSNEVSCTTPTPSMVGSSNIPIGETKVLTKSDAGNGNLLVAQQTNLTRAATIQSLSFDATRASDKLRLGMFDATQLPTHALTVINGTGSGNYSEGTQIRVSANQAGGRPAVRTLGKRLPNS
jgi:Fibronectin type III domain